MGWIEIIEMAAAAIGFVYLILEYKVSSLLWIFGIVMYALYTFVFFMNGVYAQMAIDLYYLAISVVGLVRWKRNPSAEGKTEVLSLPKKLVFPVLFVTLVLCVSMPWFLHTFTDEDVWLLDGVSAGFGMVAMWLLTKKYYQQWIFWMIFNPLVLVISIEEQMWGTVCLYVAYTVIAVLGFFKWRKIYRTSLKEYDDSHEKL